MKTAALGGVSVQIIKRYLSYVWFSGQKLMMRREVDRSQETRKGTSPDRVEHAERLQKKTQLKKKGVNKREIERAEREM